MRILQIHNRYRQPGGEDAVVSAEAEALRDAGHEVHQLSEVNPSSSLAAAGALVVAPWNPRASGLVGRVVGEVEPDVAHIHNTWFTLSPAIFRTLRKRNIPVVMTLHNFRLTCSNALLFRDGAPCELCIGSTPWHAVRYACYRDSRLASVPAAATIQLHRWLGTWVNDIDLFIALTDSQRQIMIRAGLPSQKIVIKPNFVSDPGGRVNSPSESDMVLYAGRLTEEKGARLLLEAWSDAAPAGLTLVIAGDGPDRASLERDLPASVRMTGLLSPTELSGLMSKARALVLPSLWYEGFPRVLVESFAAGLPTVVSDGGGPAEVVTRILGPRWVFRSRDRSELSKIVSGLTDGDWCESSGLLARQAYESTYSQNEAAERLVQIYSKALSAFALSQRSPRSSEN